MGWETSDARLHAPGAGRRGICVRPSSRSFVRALAFPERWRALRTGQLTALVQKLAGVVRAARLAATLSAAVMPDPEKASAQRFQDWGGWLRQGLIDVVCPMVSRAAFRME